MIPETFYSNLASWVAQVFVIASLGALLPQVFRIRHPRTQLAYGHLVLAVCLVLPLIQPWQPLMPSLPGAQSAPFGVAFTLERIALWMLVAGLVVRLGWLMGGCFASADTGLRPLRFVRFPSLSGSHANAFVLRHCLASRQT